MEDRENVLEQLSPELGDKEKWEVKVYVDLKQMKDDMFKINAGIKEEKSVHDELNKKLNEYKEKSYGWMRKQALDAKLAKIPPQESNEGKKALILKSTFLVLKESRENFTRVAKCLGEEYKRRGLDLVCTGPKPPYDFLEEY